MEKNKKYIYKKVKKKHTPQKIKINQKLKKIRTNEKKGLCKTFFATKYKKSKIKTAKKTKQKTA